MFLLTILAAFLLGIIAVQLHFVLGHLARAQIGITSLTYSLSQIDQKMEILGNNIVRFDDMSKNVGDVAHRTQQVAEQLQELSGSFGTDGKKWSRPTFHEQIESIKNSLAEVDSNIAVSIIATLDRIESNTDRLINSK